MAGQSLDLEQSLTNVSAELRDDRTGVSRVVYDISVKPAVKIEWE